MGFLINLASSTQHSHHPFTLSFLYLLFQGKNKEGEQRQKAQVFSAFLSLSGPVWLISTSKGEKRRLADDCDSSGLRKLLTQMGVNVLFYVEDDPDL